MPLFCFAGAVAAPFAQAAVAVDVLFDKAAGAVDVLFCKSVGAVGLYHVHPCSSSCFPAPQQAFVGEIGQKRRLVAASSYVFEKGRNFCKQVGR